MKVFTRDYKAILETDKNHLIDGIGLLTTTGVTSDVAGVREIWMT